MLCAVLSISQSSRPSTLAGLITNQFFAVYNNISKCILTKEIHINTALNFLKHIQLNCKAQSKLLNPGTYKSCSINIVPLYGGWFGRTQNSIENQQFCDSMTIACFAPPVYEKVC